MAHNKLILSAALTGAATNRSHCPHIPFTPKELGEEAKRAVDAGASIVHIHAREDDGTPSWRTEVFEQIQEEVQNFIDLVFEVYKTFGFDSILIKLSTRPEKRVGSDDVWDKSEKALSDALDSKGLDWSLLPGEGAFYGPKIEFSLKDCLNRVWQCGTIQVDFSMPERLNANYIDITGRKQTPVMLHRAILGSFERFIGIMIEEYSGKLPLWLAPQQVVVASIITDANHFVDEILTF